MSEVAKVCSPLLGRHRSHTPIGRMSNRAGSLRRGTPDLSSALRIPFSRATRWLLAPAMVLALGFGAPAAADAAVLRTDSNNGNGHAATPIMLAATAPAVSSRPKSRPLPSTSTSAAPKASSKIVMVPQPRARPATEERENTERAAGIAHLSYSPVMPPPKPRLGAFVSAAPAFADTPRIAAATPVRRGGVYALSAGNTSLIGVMETSSGRQALLRTGSGRVVKVTRGNTIEGWQVQSIARDSIQL